MTSLLFGDTAHPEDVTRHPGPWPPVNQRIEIFGSAWGAWLPSRVEDRGAARLVVAAPQDPSGIGTVRRPTDWLALRWTGPRGIGMLEASVVAASRAGILPTWELVARGEPALFQRRRYARVPVVLPGRAVGRRSTLRLTVVDIAEGGVRALAAGPVPFEPAEAVDVHIDVDGPLTAPAVVLRHEVAAGGTMVVFRFTDLPRADADRLRRFVYRLGLAQGLTRAADTATAGKRGGDGAR